MVEITRGNLLDADVEALVNTVNTVGVMGKGIALQFRKAFPRVYDAYKSACDAGMVKPGQMLVAQTGRISGPRLVINFPTKRHWRGKSRLEDIDAGLRDLVRVLEEWDVRSVAVPPLGCGNGGLDWNLIRPRIEQALRDLERTHVLLFEPAGAPAPQEQPVRTSRPRMTRGRAALVAALAAYQTDPTVPVTQLVVQKLAYLLQASGEPLGLRFAKGPYGPYAEAVNHVVQRMDGHFLHGSGDRTAVANIRVASDALDEAATFLSRESEAPGHIIDVQTLIAGFESPFGLELLTTVHWAAHEGGARTAAEAATYVASWSPRKQHVFPSQHIDAAWEQLRTLGWLGTASSFEHAG
ncbi:MAG: Appr-p processing protein [Conexibacter sp.]|nr:Appr-p processing protein [Conexibacter sp.]